VTYTYDALGNRISETVTDGSGTTSTTQFAYDPSGQLIGEMADSGQWTSYLANPQETNDFLARVDSNGVTWLLTDHQGSVTVALSADGSQALAQANYDAFGNVTLVSGTGADLGRLGWQGGMTDAATGLVHFGARDYDPTTARWQTPDPANADINTYRGMGNSPTNLTDPMGLAPPSNGTELDLIGGYQLGKLAGLRWGYQGITNPVLEALPPDVRRYPRNGTDFQKRYVKEYWRGLSEGIVQGGLERWRGDQAWARIPREGLPVAKMDSAERLSEAARRSLKYAGPEARAQLNAFINALNSPQMAVVVGAWTAGHVFGVSQLVDAFLFGFGLYYLGEQAIHVGQNIGTYIGVALNAKTDADLDLAGQALARAATTVAAVAGTYGVAKSAKNAVGQTRRSAAAVSAAAETELLLNRAIPGMAKAPGYELPENIAKFADQNQARLSNVVGDRMRRVGVPDEMIGIDYYGVDKGAFVRYDPPQLGGNIRVGLNGKPGINVDPAVFDANAPKMGKLSSWRSASVQDRIDAVIAHEYTEALAPQGQDFHIYALKNAENTSLKISDRARQILREYRQAQGY
jgi:RHS repeat-associated protein